MTLQCTDTSSPDLERRVAVKVNKGSNPRLLSGVMRERDILLQLSHDNVLELLYHVVVGGGSHEDEEDAHLEARYSRRMCLLILELMDSRDLADLIHQHSRFETGMGLYVEIYSYQLFRGLGYLSLKKVMHRDIKGDNLLICHRQGILKLADFGCAAKEDGEPHTPTVGNRDFRAPELMMGSTLYTSKVDIWSAAVVLCQMVLLRLPYGPCNDSSSVIFRVMDLLGTPTRSDCEAMNVDMELMDSAVNEGLSDQPQSPGVRRCRLRQLFYSSQPPPPPSADLRNLVPLLEGMLVYNPNLRMGPWEVLASPFYEKLREPNLSLPDNHRPAPPMFSFTDEEIGSMPDHVRRILVRD